jgi:PKD repeat protein
MKNYLLPIALTAFAFSSCNKDKDNSESIACFDMPVTTAKVGEEIQFSNCSENASSYSWDFGDGTTSILKEPSHVYAQAGNYEIKLLAGEDFNADGILNHLDEPDSITKDIIIDHNLKSIELTIKDANSWTHENPDLSVVADADVKLYAGQASFDADEPDYTVKSDESGLALFYDLPDGNYFMVAEKGDLSNIHDGYLISGVFQTQVEIDNAPRQDGAAVGGFRYTDINGDVYITEDDKTSYAEITVSSDGTYTKTVYIGK